MSADEIPCCSGLLRGNDADVCSMATARGLCLSARVRVGTPGTRSSGRRSKISNRLKGFFTGDLRMSWVRATDSDLDQVLKKVERRRILTLQRQTSNVAMSNVQLQKS